MAKKDLMEGEHAVSTSRLGRLFNTGRSAVGLARTMLGSREGEVDLEALSKLTRRLGELKGMGMKMGQILSFIDPSLPPETRSLLAVLQRQAPASEAAADAAFETKQMMKDKLSMMKLGLPAHILFVLRLRFGLYAVLSRIGACCDWAALEAQPTAFAAALQR